MIKSLKLSEKMQGFRADRPSEWLMDEYIRDAKNLEQERDHLQARVAELEETLLQEYSTHPHTCDLCHDFKNGICNCDAQAATEVLGRSASQSLARRDARVKAEALRDFAESRRKEDLPLGAEHKGRGSSIYNWESYFVQELRHEAERLEAEAEGL